MQHLQTRYVYPSNEPVYQASELTVAELVGQVYEAAPVTERSRLIEHLMRPLGVLALVAVANGVFAKAWFRSEWPGMHVRLEDVNQVKATDVVALVDRVQMASVEAVDGLAQVLAGSPLLAGSAAAVMLVTILLQRSKTRRADDTWESGSSNLVP